MRSVKYKPYSKTSYLSNVILLTDQSPLPEYQHILAMQQKELKRLHLIIEHKEKIIESLSWENENLRAVNKGQRDALFGRSSEKRNKTEPVIDTADAEYSGEPQAIKREQATVIPMPKAKRGAVKGHKGHGRKIPELSETEIIYEIPTDTCCPRCHDPYADTGLTEDSYEIHVETTIVRRKHKRKRAARRCSCEGPRFITASKPPQVIPKGMFSHAFLSYVLVMKFFFHTPLHRLLSMLHMKGLAVNESTLIGNFKALNNALTPLYHRLVQINKEAKHWNVDETGWKIFTRINDKLNFKWWMWVFACHQTVVYVLDASRAGAVLLKHFGADSEGTVSSDRFSAYLLLSRLRKGLINAFCWAHFRRDFIKAAKEYKELKPWAEQWLVRVLQMYRMNRRRLAVLHDPVLLPDAQSELEQGLTEFLQQINHELQSPIFITRNALS